MFSDGSQTQYKASVGLVPMMIPQGAQIRKIVLWYNSTGFLISIQLFGANDAKLLEFGWFEVSRVKEKSQTYFMEVGERIIGIRSRAGTDACQNDFQFVIGSLY